MADYQQELDALVESLNRKSLQTRSGTDRSVSMNQTGLAALLQRAIRDKASDILLIPGARPTLRIHGSLLPLERDSLTAEEVRNMLLPVLSSSECATLAKRRTVDLAFENEGGHRFRMNVHHQRGVIAAAIRLLPHEIPAFGSLGLPPQLRELASLRQGLILLTGPTGSGKSTTMAALIKEINAARDCHIITVEEPIEFMHVNQRALIEQVEIGRDAPSFKACLRSILRQMPDVLLVGEMRDAETIAMALTAAETGHLVLSSLHTNDTAQAISRILDLVAVGNQHQVRQQFSLAFAAIVAQQLIPSADKSRRHVACEILLATDAMRNLIRHGQDHQLRSQILLSRASGMISMEHSLLELVQSGKIDRHTALAHCFRKDEMETLLASS